MKMILALAASALLALALAASLGADGTDGSNAEAVKSEAVKAEAVERGRAQVEKNCGRCHSGAQRDALVRRKVGDGNPAEVLEGFLPKHHAPDAALRADVIAFLQHRFAQPAGG